MKKRVLLGVFAHPDDESFGPGGTLARYAAEGAAVHVIIATDGMAGSVEDPAHLQTHESLAQVRSTELSNAAVALGITTVWSLRFRDSGMRGAPENEHPDALIQQAPDVLVDELRGYIRRLQPDVIITHDPFGGYGHPDHVRCYETVTAAFYLAAAEGRRSTNGYHGPQKLYYTAFDKWWLKIMVRTMLLTGKDPTAFGRNKDINLAEISEWETPVHTRIDITDYLPRKLAASQAHASQYSGGPSYMMRVLPRFVRRRFQGVDTFTRAFPAPNGKVEHDLFVGLV